MNRVTVLLIGLLTLLTGACTPDIDLKLQVVDADGTPVAGAFVHGYFYQEQVVQGRSDGDYTGTTDADGRVTLSGEEDIYVKVKVTKDGYYDSYRKIVVRPIVFNEDETQMMLLKTKRNPVPLHAKHVLLVRDDLQDGQPYGYDLFAGDFVAPHGKGVVSDFVLTYTRQVTDTFNYSWTLDISFSGEEDGLIPVNFETTDSALVSDYEAPAEGYVNQWTLHQSRAGVFDPPKGNIDKWRSYYFRVRSFVDPEGNAAGHYGKMYGEFPAGVYYVNPTLGDRNVEWAVRRNLLRSLRVPERPTDP